MTRKEGPFAKNLFGSFVRTFVWSVGEVENFDFAPESQKKDNMSSIMDTSYHTKAEDGLSKFILLIFIFLFVIVMMNVLNAFAIGDIQVLKCSHRLGYFLVVSM